MPNKLCDFIHDLQYADIPPSALHAARRALLDLLGVAAAGTQTQLTHIIQRHTQQHFAAPAQAARLLFNGSPVSATGAALAGGMMIDSVDAHDGYKPAKGHIGCAVLPALLALYEYQGVASEASLLRDLVLGYELGARTSVALHQTVTDYHTSGAWVALACAGVAARILGLDNQTTQHALGIAEYHGPRSQMMRCIDHPTMLKDGSGWGAMAGVSAAMLAADGFTGAPALTTTSAEVMDIWADLGSQWRVQEQYVKPYPVCRWAQPAIIAALALVADHDFDINDVSNIEIGSFHESIRLACRHPQTTEQAQYSLAFPVAVALLHGDVGVTHIDGAGLNDPKVNDLVERISLCEIDRYNPPFPERRISHVKLTLRDGRVLDSGATEAAGDPEHPFSDEQMNSKFNALASPILGEVRSTALRQRIWQLPSSSDLQELNQLIYPAPVA